ncbi:MAG: D-alanyl-D-alanine carboxypeptidase/D-alanyl-D-alanine-endopeptidase [Burkholderiaceae bacterium]|jgi:D-alanyl-D-alanine carboxypeptidase/D-alanyl-D-alanine-endopeptidase (penicillin-binding protein 4)|nr:D-alanyl-D-alanine carboxypeptidase/D-alanyl-D-alanine-endopeptidase [Burkholderiaceae bacterium]
MPARFARPLLLAACALLLPLAAAHAQTALPDAVSAALERASVPPEAVSMVVAPLPPPSPGSAAGSAAPAARLDWQADKPMNLASVTKLFTTYAALDMLGPGYFWKNRVSIEGQVKDGVLRGNLIIKGSGDPKLVHERLLDLVAAIRERGIQHIVGDVVLDDGIFSLPPHDAAAFDGDPLRPYNAGPSGMLVNFGALVFKFQPDAGGQNAVISTEPPVAGIDIAATVPLARGACGDWRARLKADFSNPSQIRFKGSFPAACGEQSWAIAYPDAAHFAQYALEGAWRAAGGSLTGQVRTQKGVAEGAAWVTGFSLPLAQIIADVNKLSNNVMAQQVFLTLSAARGGRGSFQESQNAFAHWWRGRFGARAVPVLDNGAGLSRQAHASAASLTALLQQAASGPNAAAFVDSLSVAGVDGTTVNMRARNPDSQALGNAHLKTGSLRDVNAIAGYAYGRSGQTYTVVGIINHPNASNARAALDRLVEWAVQD